VGSSAIDAGRLSAADHSSERAGACTTSCTRRCAFDVLLCPIAPIVAPRLDELTIDASNKTNLLVLRNPALVNFLDGCAISIPIHRRGDPPVGLMLIGAPGQDRRLLAIAEQAEAALQALRR
jgi:aspartyl-tRNA(Asn)/glutamyl-tRNA(Gln) amidotransferase subunit A